VPVTPVQYFETVPAKRFVHRWTTHHRHIHWV